MGSCGKTVWRRYAGSSPGQRLAHSSSSPASSPSSALTVASLAACSSAISPDRHACTTDKSPKTRLPLSPAHTD